MLRASESVCLRSRAHKRIQIVIKLHHLHFHSAVGRALVFRGKQLAWRPVFRGGLDGDVGVKPFEDLRDP